MIASPQTPAPARTLSLEALLALDESIRIEIIAEEIVPMPAAGGVHHMIAANIYRLLDRYVSVRDIGLMLFDGFTYLMYSPAGRLKDSYVPDVSFLSAQNIPAGWEVEKPHPGTPDVAVEIMSPGDDAELLLTKIRTYLEKGTQQVWVIYPRLREVHQYLRSEPARIRLYRGDESVDAEALFPGIEGLTLPAIFKLPAWVQAQQAAPPADPA